MPLIAKSFSNLITFTRASTATYFAANGVLTSAANDVPRFDYDPTTYLGRGILIEESRTNSIRNNTMVGAVAGVIGSGGAFPTNWVGPAAGTSGLTYEIIGTGTENGINYIDVKASGTATANNFVISCEAALQIAATNGQSWANSFYFKIIAQPSPFASYTNRIRLNDSGGAGLGQIDTVFTPTTSIARYFSAGTIAAASTAFVQPQIRFGMTVGLAYDVTFRIGLPQLEQGAFATSVIPTTTTALTRSADVASVNTLSPWYNAATGTVYAEFDLYAFTAGQSYRFAFSDGTTSNQLRARLAPSGTTQARHEVVNSGVSTTLGSPATINLALTKEAFAYAANDYAGVVNNGTPSTSATLTVPSVNVLQLGATVGGASGILNGHLRRITYYPRRLANADLQAITA